MTSFGTRGCRWTAAGSTADCEAKVKRPTAPSAGEAVGNVEVSHGASGKVRLHHFGKRFAIFLKPEKSMYDMHQQSHSRFFTKEKWRDTGTQVTRVGWACAVPTVGSLPWPQETPSYQYSKSTKTWLEFSVKYAQGQQLLLILCIFIYLHSKQITTWVHLHVSKL